MAGGDKVKIKVKVEVKVRTKVKVKRLWDNVLSPHWAGAIPRYGGKEAACCAGGSMQAFAFTSRPQNNSHQ